MKVLKSIFLFSFLILAGLLSAQSGLQFYGGLSSANNNDLLITPDGHSHSGFHLGADARLVDGKMYFILGGQYHKISFLSSPEKSYFSVDEGFNWMKLRVGLGFNLFQITDNINFRAKSLISFNFISQVPTDIAAPYSNYNGGTVGGVLGIGFDIYNFTIDAEYEKGFFKAVNMVDGTEFNFFTFSLGYKI